MPIPVDYFIIQYANQQDIFTNDQYCIAGIGHLFSFIFTNDLSAMKYIICILCVFQLISVRVYTQTGNTHTGFVTNPIVAHRGAWKKNSFPENSIASLRQAISDRYAGSEFDVRMTADDSLVINHDPAFNGHIIGKTNYADLAVYKLSNGEKIPTLREYLRAGIENNNFTKLVCEIKPSGISKERGKAVAGKVLEMVHMLGAEQMVSYISFDYDILKEIVAINPAATTQYLEGNKSPDQLKEDGITGADYYFTVFKNHPEWIESAKRNGITLNAWTVNEAADMDWLLANGFDYITTNEPELLFERLAGSPVSSGWKLIWSDEFSKDGLPDSSRWGYNVGGNGWGNNELQYYTDKDTMNACIKNGVLHITARKQQTGSNSFSSARLLTKNKFAFTYGRVEVSAKIPSMPGTWPAVWMLGTDIDKTGWPACGEIDIMEHKGSEPNKIYGTLHYPGHSGDKANGRITDVPTAVTAFHQYAVEWDAAKICIYVDGRLYHTVDNNQSIPFNHDFFILLNLAIGGNFGGKVDPSFSTDAMQVDYVRVFQKQ